MKIKKRRYVEEASKSCKEFVRNLKKGSSEQLSMGSVGLLLAQASRWAIEDIHNLWEIDLTSTDFTNLGIPHHIMAIEYEFPTDLLTPWVERHRIDPRIEDATQRVALIGGPEDELGFAVISWWRSLHAHQPTWVFAPNYAYITHEHLMNTDPWMGGGHITLCTEMDPRPHVPIIKGLVYPVEQQINQMGYTTEQMATDLVDDIKLILSIMAMLSCTNIEVVSEAPSIWLNKKRKKKGKRPLPQYHAITLHNSKTSRKAHKEAAEEERTHASPRPHWRRGHPRTYASGKKVWVRPCRIRGGTGDLPDYEMI